MTVALLLLAGLSMAVPGAGAQEDPVRELQPEQTRVTALVRAALAAPDAPESWAGLAQGLSGLKAGMPLEATGLEAAIHLADSLAFSSLSTDASFGEAEGLRLDGREGINPLAVKMRTLVGNGVADPTSLISLLGLGVGIWFLLGRAWSVLGLGRSAQAFVRLIRGVSRVAGGMRSTPEETRGGKRDPRAMALALSEHGLPANEVARRTGLAQDEVAVVLALRGRSGAFGPGTVRPSRRSA